MLIKKVGEAEYIKKGRYYFLYKEGPSSRRNSWITLAQIDKEFPEFVDIIAEVLFDKDYREDGRSFARSILTFLNLWKFVTWKQFDSIFRMYKNFREYKAHVKNGVEIHRRGDITSIKTKGSSFTYRGKAPSIWTDREMDRLHEHIFGFAPMFEEAAEDGFVVAYDKDGSRYFSLPEANDSFENYVFPRGVINNFFQF